jgi:hypothetical protein
MPVLCLDRTDERLVRRGGFISAEVLFRAADDLVMVDEPKNRAI